MSRSLPVAARLAWWGTAWLRGHVVTDLAVDAVLDGDAGHVVVGLDSEEHVESLVGALAHVRSAGAHGLGAAFPREGDPVGLGGPAEFTSAALDSGEAVLILGTSRGLVPRRVGAAVTWLAHAADPRTLPDVGEADRGLRQALLVVSEGLADLDVARWRPEVADDLMDLRRAPGWQVPPGVPARCVELAARSLRASSIVELALADDAGALSGSDMDRRRSLLTDLDRAARRGLTAACSPDVWPPD